MHPNYLFSKENLLNFHQTMSITTCLFQRDWSSTRRRGEGAHARLQDPRDPRFYFYYNRQNGEAEWEDVEDLEQVKNHLF